MLKTRKTMNEGLVKRYRNILLGRTGASMNPDQGFKMADEMGPRIDKKTADAIDEMQRLGESIESMMARGSQESVPAEMLGLFTEARWPELIVEFQPSLMTMRTRFNSIELRQKMVVGIDDDALVPKECPAFWIMFNRGQELLMRLSNESEVMVLNHLSKGQNIRSATSLLPWERRDEVNNYVTEWAGEGLIIDVGVPIPKDAIFA